MEKRAEWLAWCADSDPELGHAPHSDNRRNRLRSKNLYRSIVVTQQQANAQPPSAAAMRLATAYIASQLVNTTVKLCIPDILGDGAMTAEELAHATGAQSGMMCRLLRALAAFDVVTDLGTGRFELTPVGQTLRSDSANSVRPLVELFGSENFWQTFASLSECVKTGQNAYQILYGLDCSFDYYEEHPELARIFDDAMSTVSGFVGSAIARTYDFTRIHHVIDVGGGHGKILASILGSHPHLRGTVFDLPRVVEGAPSLLAREGVAHRCKTVAGDMFSSIPVGGDLYLLCNVIHDWDDEHATKVLRACSQAMAVGAKLVMLERVMPERIEPRPMVQANVLLDLRMLVGTCGGRERTERELDDLLGTARLRLSRILATGMPTSIVEASPA
jgi:O-methyltransferase domain/Dimerisation domain